MTQHAAALVYPAAIRPLPATRTKSRPACAGCAWRCRSRSTTSTCGRAMPARRAPRAGPSSTPACRRRDRERLAHALVAGGPLGGKPITRVFVTHMHPDHIGLAGWMTRKFDCRLWMTRLEYLNCRVLVADTGREAPEDGVRFFRAAGWSDGRRSRTTARASAASAR